MRGAILAAALVSLAGCGAERATPVWRLAQGARYLDDATFRRQAMVQSLTRPDNSYAAQRLASYGLVDRGWDRLPVWRPASRVFEAADATALARGGPRALADRPPPAPLWGGERPTTIEAWVALGREVFLGYPLRAEPLVEWAVTQPAVAAQYGLERLPDGSYPGLRVITDTDGSARVGITCALCHSAVEDGRLVIGRARRSFDFGALRIAYHAASGVPADPDLLRRMKTWGPGRADVTEDDEDPVAIPDLWGLAAQTSLTQGGTIQQSDDGSPVALALRQETQYLHANHHRVRPPRELALALAFYLQSLTPPSASPVHDRQTARGATVFAQRCAACHDNAAYGGKPVEVALIGTDPALALGRSRGTGAYRPAPLLDVRHAAPYLHHGAVATLGDLLSTERLRDDYRGPLGVGAVRGHAFGLDLATPERSALIAFLETL